jgi:hypothetical protein
VDLTQLVHCKSDSLATALWSGAAEAVLIYSGEENMVNFTALLCGISPYDPYEIAKK